MLDAGADGELLPLLTSQCLVGNATKPVGAHETHTQSVTDTTWSFGKQVSASSYRSSCAEIDERCLFNLKTCKM